MLKLTKAFAAATVAALALAACGGSDGGSNRTTTTTVAAISADAWTADVNALCATANEEIMAIPADLDVEEQSTALAGVLSELSEGITAAGGPEGVDAGDVDEFVAKIDEGVGAFSAGGSEDDLAGTAEVFIREFDAYGALLGLENCNFSGGDTDGDPLGDDEGFNADAAAWASEAEEVCATLNDQNGELFAEFSDNPIDHAWDLQLFLEETLEQLGRTDASPGPSGLELISALEDLAGTAAAMSSAVEDLDADALTGAMGEFSDATAPVNDAADAAGAPSCGGF